MLLDLQSQKIYAYPYKEFKLVFDSSPAILAVSPFAMERQLYSLATHGATS